MKKQRKWIILAIVVAVIAAIAGGAIFVLSQDDVLDMADVYSTIGVVAPYFIPFVLFVLLAMIVSTVLEAKLTKKKMFLYNFHAFIAGALAFILTVNVICLGPMATILNQVFPDIDPIGEEVSASSAELAEEIANQGTVLLKNENNVLPMAGTTLNVFGWASTNPCYGGTGSGGTDASQNVTLLQGLANAGIETNTELSDFYVNYRADRPEVSMWSQDWTLPEPKVDAYSADMMTNAKNFSDTALVVITRVGGEGADLPVDVSKVTYEGNEGDFAAGEHYLQLSKSEEEMLELVTDNFDKVVVLYNGSNAMELDFVEEYGVDGLIWLASPGKEGFNALGRIMTGDLNPSGKTTDIFLQDLESSPTWNNYGVFPVENAEGYNFVNYVEGIYVGYMFYETFYMNDATGYDEVVQYPFGYGLSYTSFEQEMSAITKGENGNFSFDVTVTNTGDVTGKDVVEVFVTAPYYEGGIEKAHVALLDFGKTGDLEPGASETISFTINEEDMASYDEKVEGAYVLDQGDYEIKIMLDSHTMLDSQTYSVASKVVYNAENPRSSDETVAENRFEFAEGEVTYLSRENNFENYEEVIAAPATYSLSAEAVSGLSNHETYEFVNNPDDVMPTLGADNDVMLYDLLGKDYDDPMWETLLDKLTVAEMVELIALGGYQTIELESIGKLATRDADGPAGFSSFFNELLKGTPFPGATMIAATWNKQLAYERGIAMAAEADYLNVSGWYAPAMNIHRSAFSGRNFEYYSEDPVLSGAMAAQETLGAQENGLYVYLKHFALNDQEFGRIELLTTWSNEQAIRQIYLKPFEDAVKDGGATAIMSAFNYIGNEWAGGCSELLNDVLRDEWGFRGMVLTDYFAGYGFMDADKGIRNGNDIMLSPNGNEHAYVTDQESATSVLAMRQASKNILYTVVNSNAYDDYNPSGLNLTGWQETTVMIDIALVVVLLIIEVLAMMQYKKKPE